MVLEAMSGMNSKEMRNENLKLAEIREKRQAEFEKEHGHLRRQEPNKYWRLKGELDGVEYDVYGNIAQTRNFWEIHTATQVFDPSKFRITEDVKFVGYIGGEPQHGYRK